MHAYSAGREGGGNTCANKWSVTHVQHMNIMSTTKCTRKCTYSTCKCTCTTHYMYMYQYLFNYVLLLFSVYFRSSYDLLEATIGVYTDIPLQRTCKVRKIICNNITITASSRQRIKTYTYSTTCHKHWIIRAVDQDLHDWVEVQYSWVCVFLFFLFDVRIDDVQCSYFSSFLRGDLSQRSCTRSNKIMITRSVE